MQTPQTVDLPTSASPPTAEAPPAATVPRSWLLVSLALNLGALVSVFPALAEGSVLTRDRFEVRNGEGQGGRYGVFQATVRGAELILGNDQSSARLVVEGGTAKLHFGPETAPSLSLSVTPEGAAVNLQGAENQIALEVSKLRSAIEVSNGERSLIVQADATQAQLGVVHRAPEAKGQEGAPRTVEVTASKDVTSIVTRSDSASLRYALDGDSPSLEVKGPHGRVLIEAVPRPRLVLESESGRFELGRDPKNPNVLARWEREGRVDLWPVRATSNDTSKPSTEPK